MAANLLVVLTALLPTCATSLLCYSVAQQLDLSVSCCIKFTVCALGEWLTSSSPLLQLGCNFLVCLLESASDIIAK